MKEATVVVIDSFDVDAQYHAVKTFGLFLNPPVFDGHGFYKTVPQQHLPQNIPMKVAREGR
jgi:hypothetical protein